MSVPKHHWPEALLTASYLINRIPSASLHNKIRFQLLFPDKPLFPLKPKTFGCVSFIHILPLRKDKLSAKSLKCVFLGYSRLKKGYLCYNPSLKKTFISMDVTFFEGLPFYSPSNAPLPSSHTLPISVLDRPPTTSPPKDAAPPIVYTRRPKEVSSTHLPAVPITRFVDPQIG